MNAPRWIAANWDVAVLAAALGALLWAARNAWRTARQREAMDIQLRADARGDHAT